jgi:ABC-type glycerol-3-phosphate transport system substrate-binding protein
LNKRIQILKDRRPSMVPLWIGRWKTVENSSDIISQFLMLEWVEDLWNISSSKLKSALSTYFMYADSKVNGYDEKVNIMESSNRTNLDLFSRWEIAMVVWYPKMLLDIDKKWFRKSALYAKPFPWYFDGSWKSLVNYNYFVINKDTKNENAAVSFLQYLNSDKGSLAYFKKFPYYLPARVSLEEDVLDMPIKDWYNVKLEDFNNQDLEKASFDKKIKLIYDREIVKILDDKVWYLNRFIKMKDSLICKFKKVINFEWLSNSCEK